MKRLFIFILFIVPILTALYIYPWQQLAIWLQGNQFKLDDFVFTLLASTIVIPLFIYGFMRSKEPLRKVAVELMGAGQLMLLAIVITALLTAFFDINNSTKAFIAMALGFSMIAYAVYKALSIRIVRRDIPISGLEKPLRIVHLSDIHLGSRKVGLFEELVTITNRENPDFVVISGDLVDTSNVTERDITPVADFKAPVIFSSGNHDTYVHYDDVLDWLKAHGVHVLENASIELNAIQFMGLTDQNNPKDALAALDKLALADKPKVLSYHRPDLWRLIKDKNIDLMLAGHTHRGQIFPFNFLVGTQFKEIAGFYQREAQYLNVSQGSGTWGPTMRLGTQSEIVVLNLTSY